MCMCIYVRTSPNVKYTNTFTHMKINVWNLKKYIIILSLPTQFLKGLRKQIKKGRKKELEEDSEDLEVVRKTEVW